ncbi:MAG: HAD family hydrolase [Wenzhouxiangella sp.]
MTVELAILDIDGTLIDSNDAHAHAWVDACEEFGYAASFKQVRPLIGMSGSMVTRALTSQGASDPKGERLQRRRAEIFRKHYLPGLDATPGARALLTRLKDDGIGCIVATSASPDDVAALLAQAGVDDLIKKASAGADVDASKPAPDIVQAALTQAACPAWQALMLGDTPYDIDAAIKAGVSIIALRCGGWWSDQDLRAAHAILDDPAALLERYHQSPFAPKSESGFDRRD